MCQVGWQLGGVGCPGHTVSISDRSAKRRLMKDDTIVIG